MSERISLAEFFVKAGTLRENELQRALRPQQQQGGFSEWIMETEGWINEQELYRTLSKMTSITCEALDSLPIEAELLQLVPKSVAMRFQVMPLFIHDGILYMAMENPSDITLLQSITSRTRMQIKPLRAPLQQLRTTIGRYYCDE